MRGDGIEVRHGRIEQCEESGVALLNQNGEGLHFRDWIGGQLVEGAVRLQVGSDENLQGISRLQGVRSPQFSGVFNSVHILDHDEPPEGDLLKKERAGPSPQ